MREFLQDRIRLVHELLADDAPQVAYADLALILCSVISACAALRWPGRGIDRKRFVELLVQESPEEYHASWICVPELINSGRISEANTPYGKPGQSTRIFRDDEIDLPYDTAQSTYSRVAPKCLKASSYAVLIYEWLRCGYAHEYCPHKNVTHVPASRSEARVSYIGRNSDNGIIRMASFHLDYLIALANYHASGAVDTPSPPPAKWWIESE